VFPVDSLEGLPFDIMGDPFIVLQFDLHYERNGKKRIAKGDHSAGADGIATIKVDLNWLIRWFKCVKPMSRVGKNASHLLF
jgi:hypothetical protein